MDYGQAGQQLSVNTNAGRFMQAKDMPTQPSPVQLAQSNLDSCIVTLGEAMSALEGRLQPVLTAIPESEGTPNKIRPVASTVAHHINDSAENIVHITARVQRLLDRLEV